MNLVYHGGMNGITRILFVCHGNICRSPMAEFVMKDLVERRGVADSFVIESAATSTEEIGNPVHYGTASRLAEAGISCAGKHARQIKPGDYDGFDMIVGMDSANMRNMERVFKGDPEGKLYKLLEFAGSGRDVADPWYTGDFDRTYEDVCDGCEGLFGFIAGRSS